MTNGAIYTLQLTLHDGKLLQWRFIQGSDMGEVGGGLAELPAAPVPTLAYREQGAVAAEGTTIQIGNIASPAEFWTEISKPPYFIAWHASYSLNNTSLIFAGLAETWTVTSSPSTLISGSTWTLNSSSGRQQTIRVGKVDGQRMSLAVDSGPGSAKRLTDANWDGSNWHYSQVHMVPREGERVGLTLQFAPPLSGDGTSTVDVIAGKKKIAAAVAKAGPAGELTLSLRSPGWAKSKSVTETLSVSASDIRLQSTPR